MALATIVRAIRKMWGWVLRSVVQRDRWLLSLLAWGVGALSAIPVANAQSWRESHTRAVAQYRAGNAATALIEIERALTDRNADRVVQHDAVVIAQAAQKPEKATAWAEVLDLNSTPEYVLRALGRAARDTGAFARARGAYEAILNRTPGDIDAVVGKTLSLVGEKRLDEALTTINAVTLTDKSATAFSVWEARALVAEAFGREVDVLRAVKEMLLIDPNSSVALRLRFASARRLGLAQIAGFLTPTAILTVDEKNQLRRDALIADARFPAPGESVSAFRFRLDNVIDNLAQYASTVKGTPEGDRAFWDLITIMLDRGHAKQAYALLEPELKPAATFPLWFQGVIAQILLANQKPFESVEWFERVLKAGADSLNTKVAYFYALLECERLDDAANYALSIRSEVEAAFKAGTVEASDVQRLRLNWVRALLYSDELVPGTKALDPIQLAAPASDEVNGLRTESLSYRGRLFAAHEHATWLLGRIPENAALLTQIADIELQRGDREAARTTLHAARVADPEARGPMRAERDRAINDSALLRLEFNFGNSLPLEKTSADQNNGLTLASPARERRTELTVYSPWMDDTWRGLASAFTLQDWSATGEEIKRNGAGVGIEWSARDVSAYGQMIVDDGPAGNQVGVTLRVAKTLNDDWRVSMGVGRNDLQLPLKAFAAGIDMTYVNASVRHQLTDAHALSLTMGGARFSDGNTRLDGAIVWDGNWYRHAHLRLNSRTELYGVRHTLTDVPYFSPSERYGIAASVTADWLHWRKYTRTLNHHFTVAVGRDWQEDRAPTDLFGFRYAQIWRFDPCTEFRFEAEYIRRGYDGKPETKRVAGARLEHRFY